jgi:hypothetical protein
VCVRGCVCSVLGFIHRFVTQSVVRSRSVLLSLHWLPQLSLEFNFLLSAVLDFQFLLSRRTFHFKFSQIFSSPLSSLNFSVFTLQTLFTTLISGLSIFSVFTSSNSFHHSWSSVFQSFWLSQFRGVSGLSLGFNCPLLISFFCCSSVCSGDHSSGTAITILHPLTRVCVADLHWFCYVISIYHICF